MVSNPHSLGLQAVIYEDGYTYDGNTKHRLVRSPLPPLQLGSIGEGLGLDPLGQPGPAPSGCPSSDLLPASLPYTHPDKVLQNFEGTQTLPLPHPRQAAVPQRVRASGVTQKGQGGCGGAPDPPGEGVRPELSG